MSLNQTFPVLAQLLAQNKQWADDVTAADPNFFPESAKLQEPKVLWIGCADSRVPESVITASPPGAIFTHRNIANQFPIQDDSANSVLEYAVQHLGVEHIIVAGHTNCGGVAAAYDAAQGVDIKAKTRKNSSDHTHLTRWLVPLVELAKRTGIASKPRDIALPLLVKANIKQQVENVVMSLIIQKAWADTKEGALIETGEPQKPVYVHGWEYTLETGKLQDLGYTFGPFVGKGNGLSVNDAAEGQLLNSERPPAPPGIL